MKPKGVVALLLTPLLLCAVAYGGVYWRYRLPLVDARLAPATRDLVLAKLRAAMERAPSQPTTALPDQALPGPIWASVFHRGKVVARAQSNAAALHAAVGELGPKLAEAFAKLDPVVQREGRLKVDLQLAEGPIITGIPFVFAKSIVPGPDGLGLRVAGRVVHLLPDDLFSAEILSAFQPFQFMRDLHTGLDVKGAVNRLAQQAGLSLEAWRAADKTYFRFRTEQFLERRDRKGALPIERFRVPVEQIKRADVLQAIERAADYVLRQMKPDGKFHYIYYPVRDTHSHGAYNLPRHAGTTWFVSLAYRNLKKPRFKRAAERAIAYLAAHAVPSACNKPDSACVGSDGYADLGSTALAVVALTEYQIATGDKRFDKLGRRLGNFMLSMQKPNGDFCHQYFPKKQTKNCDKLLLYYTGEAALALAKLHRVTGDARYRDAVERGLDFLVGEKYDFFFGQFFIGEDHWTCIAADAAYPALKKRSYLDFCLSFAKLNRRVQVTPEEPIGDLRGSLTITPWFIPHNTPAGSRTESNVGTYLLSQKWGEPNREVRDTVLKSLRFIVDQQLTEEEGYLFPKPSAAAGGFMQTAINPEIRIDYVQHCAAAMARAMPFVP